MHAAIRSLALWALLLAVGFLAAGLVAVGLLATGLASSAPAERVGGEAAGLGPGPLSPPPRQGGISLLDALWVRRSVRAFSDRAVTREELSQLLWAGTGLNRPDEKKRTSPAAWDAYAVTLYVTSAAGTVIYDPVAQALVPAGAAAARDLRAEIPRAESTQKAPVVILYVADFSRYPAQASERSRGYLAHADSGVIAQNIYLAAAGLGLGTVLTADARPESKALLGLGQDQMVLYSMPVGHPAPETAPKAKQGGK